MKDDFIFTSESLTEGHPDKLCDQISDDIVDAFLRQDAYARVYAECAASTGILFLATRFAANASVDVAGVAREVISRVGYEGEEFNARTCSIMTSFNDIPPEEYDTVDERGLSEEEIEARPALEQVTAFGFACRQTDALMPLPIWLAHKLARRLAASRRERRASYLAPDGKTQVAVEYRSRRPHRIHSIALTAALAADAVPSGERLRDDLIDLVVEPAFAGEALRPDRDTAIFINPGGPFITGGPAVHSGMTGRKTAIDTYGEYSRHSGAALSGKDPTRIDRVGAYAARHAAKNVVQAGLAEECELQLGYTIGLPRPVSIQIETFGTGRIPDAEIAGRIERLFEFRPAGIIAAFDLRRLPASDPHGFYGRLSAYGQVGRTDIDLPWERTDKAEAIAG